MSRGKKARKRQTTLAEIAYNAIKGGILRAEIQDGTFLSETAIRKRFGIGHTPFREACNRLHHEQLLQVVPRRGYFVPEVSLRSAQEIFEARLLIEGAIAELAVLKAEPAEIEELQRLADKCWPIKPSEFDPDTLVKGNTEFHLCLARMAKNRELLRIVTGILERTERLSYLEVRHSPPLTTDFQVLHTPIVEAIRKRDKAAARQAIRDDITLGTIQIFGEDARGIRGRGQKMFSL